MRTVALAVIALLAAHPLPARAQRANRSISLESGLSTPLDFGRPPALGVALGASWWFEGDAHGTARLVWTDARETTGRAVAGAVGLAWAPGPGRLRPRLLGELGWALRRRRALVEGAVSLGAGAGLEWFVRRDVAVTVEAALRRAHGTAVELSAGVRFGY